MPEGSGVSAPRGLEGKAAMELEPQAVRFNIPPPVRAFDSRSALPVAPENARVPQSSAQPAQPGMFGAGTYLDAHWRNADSPAPGVGPNTTGDAADLAAMELLRNQHVVRAEQLTPLAQKTLFLLQQRLALYFVRRALARLQVLLLQARNSSGSVVLARDLYALHALMHTAAPSALAAKMLACRSMRGEDKRLVSGTTVSSVVNFNLLAKLASVYPRAQLALHRAVHSLIRYVTLHMHFRLFHVACPPHVHHMFTCPSLVYVSPHINTPSPDSPTLPHTDPRWRCP